MSVTRGENRVSIPYSYLESEKLVKEKLNEGPYSFLANTAGLGDTNKENRNAITSWKLIPRVLKDVETIDTTVELFGKKYNYPIMLAPVAVQKIFREEGELASSKAAKECGIPFIASTASSYSLEEIAGAMGDAERWFQLYWGRDREVTASLIRRAEENGYSAIFLTVDTASFGWRVRDLGNSYSPFTQGIGLINFINDPVFQSRLEKSPEEDMDKTIEFFFKNIVNPKLNWEDLAFLKENTNLPIILKGIVNPLDAALALEYGVDGIVVSNHGARQLDGAIGTMDALPKICDVVQGRIPVFMDSGIRTASDIIKALALGADSVLIGRPYIYGLTLGGKEGVKQTIQNLLAELNSNLALTGVSNINQLNRSFLTK